MPNAHHEAWRRPAGYWWPSGGFNERVVLAKIAKAGLFPAVLGDTLVYRATIETFI